MRRPNLIWLLCITLFVYVDAQANFEDADKANEYTNQNFDLRHTIPGEPGLDYPILSAVPKTSFTCKGRHEGYYADVDSRCQAFRICAHTARSAHGFGFLCPNGTLFNQQHFVCDWYRNVKCDEAESYYEMNAASRVGSTKDMMETVRQMMEYPMKTISKALQKSPGTTPRPNHPSQAYEQQEVNSAAESPIVHAERTVGRKTAVTRAQVESVKSYGQSERGEAVKSEPIPGEGGEDVYVNSLGELSSDPGIKFDRTNAHIVAEYPREHHFQQQMNFAESVNVGLNEEEASLDENAAMAPDYIKHIRMTKDEATQLDLVSNINSLLEEVSTDLDTSVSGYQTMNPQVKIKQPFRFLSRGFSMHNKQAPYQYTKPRQTESTVRFTPNDIPIDTQKDTSYYTQKHNFEKTAVPAELLENELVLTTPEVPVQIFFDEYLNESTTLLPPEFENDFRTEATTEAAAPVEIQPSALPVIAVTTEIAQQEDTSSRVPINEAATIAVPLNEFEESNATETPIDPERVDVNQRAANLLLAGVKLTSHNEHKRVNTIEPKYDQQLELNSVWPRVSDPTTEQSFALSVSTTPMSTSTETITEISSIQERIRGYRRFAHHQRLTAPISTISTPQIYARRANVRPINRGLATRTTTAKTTSTSTTAKPTLSYLQRVAASRLRLSRLSAVKSATISSTAIPVTTTTTTTTSTTTPLPVQADQYGPNKKLSVRNIDKDTGNFNSLTDVGAKRGTATWESVHNNLQRYQVNRNRGTRPTTTTSSSSSSSLRTSTSTTTTTTTSAPTGRSTLQRNRNRFSNFKTQNTRKRGSVTYVDAIPTSKTTSAITTTTTTTTTKPPTVSAQLSLARQLSSLTASLHDPTPYTYTTTTSAPLAITAATYTFTPNAVVIDNPSLFTNTNINTNTNTNTDTNTNTVTTKRTASSDSGSASSASYLSFDKLTRAIVDNSILQNFKSSQQPATVRSSSAYQTVAANAQQKPATATSNNGYSLGKQQITAAAAPVPRLQIQQKPPIVIARAEGQRIQSNSVNNILASLATQPQTKATPSSSYVALGDFLHKKFGNNNPNPTAATTATVNSYENPQRQQQRQPTAQQQQQLSFITQRYQQQQNKQPTIQQQSQIVQQQHIKPQKSIEQQQVTQQQFHQQQQQHTQQQQHVGQQQQFHQQQQQYAQQHQPVAQSQFYQQQPEPTKQQQQIIYQSIAATANQVNPFLQPTLSQSIYQNQPNQQQQTEKQTIHSIQQPYLTPNIFDNYQQHQQQLPQFPPLVQPPHLQQQQVTSTQIGKTFVNNNNADYLNIQLPTLRNGLIPAPTIQMAQRRSDNAIGQLNSPLTSSSARSFFAGATSYDVGQSSVGRLPNDITNLLRRRLRRY